MSTECSPGSEREGVDEEVKEDEGAGGKAGGPRGRGRCWCS